MTDDKPLSDEEFEKVKARAALTRKERWSWLHPEMTDEEYDRQLEQEIYFRKKFEGDTSPIDIHPEEPHPVPKMRITFDDIGNFFKRIFGSQ